MQQSRIAYHADFVVYPVLILVTILEIAYRFSRPDWTLLLGFAIAGAVLWTLLEYLMHRFVLHGGTRIAGFHNQHHAWPRALVGTPTWVSVATIFCIALLPAVLGAPLIASLSLAAGLMAAFLWYGLTHYAIHHGKPRVLALVLAGTARRHFKHHGHENVNFGVTTSLWDWLLRTSLTTPVPRSGVGGGQGS
jgi:sterol desaturase/sphingolipid hydroxylase (fatty acid hydroxylase superfamily)